MALEPSGSADLDLLAASLRADFSDINAFVEGLAVKLEDALPQSTRVDRGRSGFRGPKSVRSIVVDAGGERLELRRDGGGVLTTKAHVSGGIVLKSEPLEIDDWLGSLVVALNTESQRSERTRQALERLLLDSPDR
jgi:hypothetical protein